MNSKAIFYALLCVLCWSLIPVVSKLGQSDLDNHQFLFYSSLVSLSVFVILCIQKKKLSIFTSLKFYDWAYALFLGFLGTYLYYILLYFGYAHAQGIEVLVIQYSWPMLVSLLSVIILKERLSIAKIMAIVLGFVGVLFVLSKGDFSSIHLDNLYVDMLVLFAAFAFALFSVLSKACKIEPLPLITIYFFSASIASFISMMFLSEIRLPTSHSLLPILMNGIFVNGISYIFWLNALKNGQASFIAPFIFATPILSMIYLVIFFGESFISAYLVGIICVIVSGLINTISPKKNKLV